MKSRLKLFQLHYWDSAKGEYILIWRNYAVSEQAFWDSVVADKIMDGVPKSELWVMEKAESIISA